MSATVSEEMLLHLAEFAGIEIAPEHRAGVIRNLQILFGQAEVLKRARVEQRVEPASVFRP